MNETPAWFTDAIETRPQLATMEVCGATIAYRSWGEHSAPVVVLVHGGAAHAGWWDHVAPLLVMSRHRVIALDLSGHGDSGRRDAYELDRWVSEVIAATQVGGAGSAVVIAHSMGSLVACRAAQMGHVFAGLIIVDGAPVDVPRDTSQRDRAEFHGNTYPTRDAILARYRLLPDHDSLPFIRERIASASITERADGRWAWKFDAQFAQFTGDISGLMGQRFSFPAAVIHGEFGIMPAEAAGGLTMSGDRPVPTIEIPAAGHHIMLDQPLALVAAIRTVLAEWSY